MAICRETGTRAKFVVIIFISICALLYMHMRTDGIQPFQQKSKLNKHSTLFQMLQDFVWDSHVSKSDKRNRLEINIKQKYMLYVDKDIDNRTNIERFLTIREGQLLLNFSKKHPQNLQRSKFYKVSFYPMAVDLPQVVNNHKLGISIYKPVNIYEYGLVHNTYETCKEDVNLLFLVKSKVSNFEQRVAIRRTWANDSLMKRLKTRRVFLLGSSKNTTDELNVFSEVREHNDIVQFDFYDDYYNNTLKTTGAIYWANTFCNNSKFFMFIDDDFFVSTERLMEYINSKIVPRKGHIYLGNVLQDVPSRDKHSKWYISEKDYPYDVYPPFVRAGAMLVSSSFIEELCIGILYTERFIFDDVFIAIVAYKLRVQPLHQPHFYIIPVSYNGKLFKYVYVSHGYKRLEELYKAWNCTVLSPSSQIYPNYCTEGVQKKIS